MVFVSLPTMLGASNAGRLPARQEQNARTPAAAQAEPSQTYKLRISPINATPRAILIWEDVYADTGGLRYVRRIT